MIEGAMRDQLPAMISVDIDPFSKTFLADPYAFHALLREAGPVFRLEHYGILGMARHEQVSRALLDWETYCSSRGVGLSDFAMEKPWRPPSLLLETDPPIHDRTRKLMNQVVAMPQLRGMRQLWQEKADTLVADLVSRTRFDAVADLAEAYPMAIFPDTIGLPVEGREHLLPYAMAAFNALGPRNALFLASEAGAAQAIGWVEASCKRGNVDPDGWAMAVYKAADAGGCTEDEAERLIRSFLSAGVDTTVNGIANTLYAFAQHPDQWQLLRANPALAKKAFEEALRWDSTVQSIFRTTTRDVTVDGIDIAAGSKVQLFLAAANRDPRRWDEPDRFDITRAASGHVGFGFGIHQCLGQMVARQEVEMVLNALLPRVAEIRLAGAPTRRLNNTLHAFASLPIELVAA